MCEQELIKQAQREYHKKWREANPDKVRERNKRYWRKQAEKLAEQIKQSEAKINDTGER